MGKSDHKVVDVDTKDLVGIQSRVEKLEKLLDLGSNVVRFVGICGMVGIGKSTLAKVMYKKISRQFDACCFLHTISEVCSEPYGLSNLREKLLCETLQQEYDQKVSDDAHNGRRLMSIRASLCFRRVLIVLDDVDELTQLEALARKRDWFGAFSKIIITTRDEQILKVHGVDEIYKVELLNKNEALRLFCINAFSSEYYPIKDYDDEKIISSALENAKGLPLAIKLLGSSLCNRDVSEWRSALAKQQANLDGFILKELQRSFDRLHEMGKQLFLDIACFFVGKKNDYVKDVLSDCGFENIEYEIGVLIDKSLLTISNERIQMHYMMQVLGREIVRRESPNNPGRQSRLWSYNDFHHVIETNIGTKYVEAIVLDLKNPPETSLKVEALSQLNCLRLLILRNVKFSGVLNNSLCLSNNLRYISWHKYPFACLPSSFEPSNLVQLIMRDSNITQLWEGLKTLPNLRNLNLRGSSELMRTPDFRGLLRLERLDLKGCASLVELDQSIELLPKLRFLNLRNCKSLVSIPNCLFGLRSLEILNLAGCSKLAECLDHDSWKTSIELKLLSIQDQEGFLFSFLASLICLAALICLFFISLLEVIMNNKRAFCFVICLIYSIFYVLR